MNISYNWLKKYLDISQSPEELSEILTSIGLEVEGIEKYTSIPGGLEGLVTGRVLECSAHPNADKLSVTVVDIGGENPLDIVCGAPNVARGQTVVVAPVGSTIYPTKGAPFEIGKVKIRGRRSEGMICAEDEIGLGDDHDGIMVLSEAFEPGTPIDQIFPVEKDVIFDIGLTPNRSDATSHMGVARDLLAYLRVHSDYQEDLKWPDLRPFKEGKGNTDFEITIEDTKACPRYSGLIIEGVQVKESPEWLKNKLKSVGLKPLNNIVDITNFVLLEYGQPLHAFDLNEIEGGGIRVKQLAKGTKFTTLDEEERELHSEDLMICDVHDRPLCMAGVFGGLKSGVSKKTTSIFLESAHFEALSIRKTSTRHLLRTEAAKIYEKGSDPALTLPALKRAALLIEEMAGGKPASPVFDHYPNPIRSQEINLVYERVRKLTGAALSKEQITVILKAMDMEIVESGPEAILVRVPTNKADVKREADLIEEILRIYGFDKIPMGDHIKIPLISSSFPDKFTLTNRIADHLCSKGLTQMMNLSLSRSSYYKEDRKDLVYVQNTSNEQLNIMRPDMVRSTVETMVHNVNRRQTDLAFFEFGKTYRIEKGDIVER